MAYRRVAPLLSILVIITLLAGCSLPAGDSNPSTLEEDPADVFEGAFVHADELESVHGERTTEIVIGNGSDAETRTERVAVYERPYVDYRSEVLESSEPDRVGDVYVSNASTTWWYDPDANAASYFAPEEPFDDDAVRSDRAEQADYQQDLYDLEYEGTETVADRDAHVLAVEAKNETVTEGLSVLVGDTEFVYALETVDPGEELVVHEQRLWIDAEYEFPLKEQLVVEADEENERYVMTERFENVTFNGDVDDETFAFEPPENATVTDLGAD
ncbi:LolA family protein [Natronobacterium texcoconense]|uniref:Outer membrane lipoprotein-sorting protein n=1 Tax=Natronobacterium texcoconense TaxID=1095778 RepID=A0A1H1AXX7_NATTX|nr:outer membrane lipoprotein carrier protein LolA [Natronobacterium texcoconense]SDQ44391.1 Outer membrane lipoprotein-sorting protein [Natronobacterium texcoconense]